MSKKGFRDITTGFFNKLNIWVVVAIALLGRVGVLLLLPNNEFPDTNTYLNAGRDLFTTGHIKADNVMPLYPIISYLLGNLLFIKLFDIVISSLTVLVVYKLAVSIFDNHIVGIFAAIITAVYPYFIFYSIAALTETTYIFLVLLAFYFLYKGKVLPGSIILVLSVLERPTLDLLAPILIFAFSYFVHKLSIKKSFMNVGLYLLVYLVLMSPWWIHNFTKYDTFVRLNLGDGITWYSGNNPLNMSGGGVVGSEKGDDVDMSEFDKIKDPIEKNNALKKAAFDYIRSNPGRFIELAGLKFVRFWRLWPYAPEYESIKYIVMSVFSFGIVLVLSIAFVLANLKKYFIKLLPIYGMILYFTAVHMVLIASLRYRLPLEPFLIIFASYALYRIYDRLLQKKRIVNG